MTSSLDELTELRKKELRETLAAWDRKDVQGAHFRRLLRFAHTEGLLAGLLREIECSQNQLYDSTYGSR